jgi:hypothetical protein
MRTLHAPMHAFIDGVRARWCPLGALPDLDALIGGVETGFWVWIFEHHGFYLA